MEDPWTMKEPEKKMSKRQQANAKVLRGLCTKENMSADGYYVDAVSGVVFASGPRERPDEVDCTHEKPKQPINYWKAAGVALLALGGLALLTIGGRALVSKLEEADAKNDKHIHDTYPREPYRDNVRGD
jgi:hypothetical protein